jgi:UDP-glucuronate 4-epimerase
MRQEMKIVVTGAAGFIGFHVVQALLQQGYPVVGIDHINNYYDVRLKFARLHQTGIAEEEISAGKAVQSSLYPSYSFVKMDLNDREELSSLFQQERFTHVIHLAAQAGVRYSLENPYAYIDANIYGFMNLLEACRHHPVEHLLYASSSSVYGANRQIPYRESDPTDHPVSLYAATKKANELMAYTYAHLYRVPSTGIRFFTVYGPWGRPDMAPSLFMSSVLNGETIRLFNHGEMERDFTYIGDIVEGLLQILPVPPSGNPPHAIYNMGCSSPVKILDFLSVIEQITGKKARVKMTGMQPGDVTATFADTTLLQKNFNYQPSTPIQTGLAYFYEWFIDFYSQVQ